MGGARAPFRFVMYFLKRCNSCYSCQIQRGPGRKGSCGQNPKGGKGWSGQEGIRWVEGKSQPTFVWGQSSVRKGWEAAEREGGAHSTPESALTAQ